MAYLSPDEIFEARTAAMSQLRHPVLVKTGQPKKEVAINLKEVLKSERQDMLRRLKGIENAINDKFDNLEQLLTT